MIRVHELIERGCRHRLFGPFVILVLVVLLASLFLHAAIEGAEAAAALGGLCVAVTAVLGAALVRELRPSVVPRVVEALERGPPRVVAVVAPGSASSLLRPSAVPLRR